MDGIFALSRGAEVVRVAYDDPGRIWQELIAEARPERRKRLLLLGLQPNFSLRGCARRCLTRIASGRPRPKRLVAARRPGVLA